MMLLPTCLVPLYVLLYAPSFRCDPTHDKSEVCVVTRMGREIVPTCYETPW